MRALKEQAVLLGPRRSLVGIVAEGAAPAGDRPTVVILNSGVVHRVGANRMSVPLARALAAAGHVVVRFDLSGLGDSDPRPDGLAPLEASLADVREVLDTLESTRGTSRVILAGLCSGADLSLLCSASDPRVVGAALLDPSLPRTLRHRAYHYCNRVLHKESWINLVRGKNPLWRTLLSRAISEPAPRQKTIQDRDVREYLESTYRQALDHGVRFLAVLTGERSYYREQLLDAFPGVSFGDRLRLEHFPTSDHMFTAHADHTRVIHLIVDWAGQVIFPAGDSTRPLQPSLRVSS